jgi:hypothetical protein
LLQCRLIYTPGSKIAWQVFLEDDRSPPLAGNLSGSALGNSHLSNCSVVHALPRRKEKDLFEGNIWIDNQDFAIVKITGHLAKKPSFWIKRVDFVRDNQKISGFWLLSKEEALLTSGYLARRP